MPPSSCTIHRLKETRLYMAANEAECSFAPDVCGLDCRAVLQNGQQREDGALREIGMLEEPARLADDVTKLEHDGLKMGLDPLAAGGLQGAEQPIVPKTA